MLKLIQAADVKSESKALDPNDAAIEICDSVTNAGSANLNNCPNASTGQDLLCRLFSILPLAANAVDLATSTALLSEFDYADTEKGNDNSIITVLDNGCKPNQCRHADGSTTSLTFAYDHGGAADPAAAEPPKTPFAITATCDCDESKGETANPSPADTADPFECVCDADQECFQGPILTGKFQSIYEKKMETDKGLCYPR